MDLLFYLLFVLPSQALTLRSIRRRAPLLWVELIRVSELAIVYVVQLRG